MVEMSYCRVSYEKEIIILPQYVEHNVTILSCIYNTNLIVQLYENYSLYVYVIITRALKCKPSAGDMIKKKPEI